MFRYIRRTLLKVCVWVCERERKAGYLSYQAFVLDGCLRVVAGTKHVLGCSRITDDQEAAGRACMHTAVLNYSQHNRHSHRLDATGA